MSMNKTMKKNDWLEIANGVFNLGLSDSETVDNLVLKIAKELDIETDSVKITDLKKQVLTKIEVINQRIEDLDETNNETISDIISQETEEPIVLEEPKIVYSELDNLRAECLMYGLGYGEKHKVSDLTQLLNQIRGKVTASMTLEEALKKITPTETNDEKEVVDNINFEITLDNVDDVLKNAPEDKNPNNTIKLETKTIAVPVSSIKNNLEVYRGTFTQTIRSHFRPQTISEIRGLFKHEYPFTHEINVNPKNKLQVEIIFTQNDISVRVPSDNPNDWIDIRE
jgi:hypothetical protein